ncbi:MAG: endonuclease domain-containing protein [Clostridia bacterium]|nr:endonuclease domain-containing protein [Clostridia bacterium]
MNNKRLPRNKSLKNLSTNLRNNATEEENKLWYEFLRIYPVRFNRQRIIGNYIVDFYCAKAKLVVEIDGSQHYENKGIKSDAERTRFLENAGLKVIRFSNLDIKESFYEVCTVIDSEIQNRFRKE